VSRFLVQLGYSVPFTLVPTGKYRTEDRLKIHLIQKLNATRKIKQSKTQQNKTTPIQSPHTTLGQETRWAYSTTHASPHASFTPQDDKSIKTYAEQNNKVRLSSSRSWSAGVPVLSMKTQERQRTSFSVFPWLSRGEMRSHFIHIIT